MTAGDDARTTVLLALAGQEIELDFAPGLEDLARHVRALWSHVVLADPGRSADGSGDAGAGDGASAQRIRRRYEPAGSGSGSAAPLSEAAARPSEADDARPLPAGPEGAYALSGDVTRALIERLRGRRLLLHAAVVERPDHGVVVLVGPSGAGKSTAATMLARGGAYLTDELAILDPHDLSVTAYPKPVSHLNRTTGRAGKRDHALPELGLVPAARAGAPTHVVILDRIGEDANPAAVPGISRMPLREALAALIGQSSSLWLLPGGLGVLADVLGRAGGALRVRYREAAELEGLLARVPPPNQETVTAITGESAARAASVAPVPSALRDASAAREPGPGEYAIVPFAQALVMDDGIQVLFEGRSVHIPDMAGLVWEELLEAGLGTADELEQRIIAHLGPHPQARELVEASLALLLSERCAFLG